MSNYKVSVFVATHKSIEHWLPEYCQKVQVNCNKQSQLWNGYFHDNEGDNISDKNYAYSELTVLYWAWKNSNVAIKGICHYRRYFTRYTNDTLIQIHKLDSKHMQDECLPENTIKERLDNGYDMILTKPYGPYPNTVKEDMKKYVYEKDMDALVGIVNTYYPEYSNAMKEVLDSYHMASFNMCIAPAQIFNKYCEWLFDVLSLTEKVTDISKYDKQHQRLYGYLGEVLLNVYIRKNNLKCCYFKAGFLDFGDSFYKKVKIYLLRKRCAFHELLYRNHMYGVMLGFYRIFYKSAYEKLKMYKKKCFDSNEI